jgi:hypothetical protein
MHNLGVVPCCAYQEQGFKPAIIYIAADDPAATIWTGDNSDIAEAVARYNPHTHYVVIGGVVD